MTYMDIEKRRNELDEEISKIGETPEIMAEWKALYEEEMKLRMEDAIAIGRNGKETIFINYAYEGGWEIYSKVDGKWDCNESLSIINALKTFADFARKHEIKTVLILPYYLDLKTLEKDDEQFFKHLDEQEYADACLASEYGDDRLLERYNRKHGIEKEYSPSNPWDAPGMKVSDFI